MDWITTEELGLREEESHLVQSDILCHPLGARRNAIFHEGGLRVIKDIVQGTPFLNPGRRPGAQLEFDFINLTLETLLFVRDRLRDRQRLEGPTGTIRGAWLIYSTMGAAAAADKSWHKQNKQNDLKRKWPGPAHLAMHFLVSSTMLWVRTQQCTRLRSS